MFYVDSWQNNYGKRYVGLPPCETVQVVFYKIVPVINPLKTKRRLL